MSAVKTQVCNGGMANPSNCIMPYLKATVPTTALYEIRPIPGKGLGVIAIVDIEAGTRLLHETPVMTALKDDPFEIYQAFIAMNHLNQHRYLELHAAPNQVTAILPAIDDDVPSTLRYQIAKIAAIFATNCFNIPESEISSKRQNGNEDDEIIAGICLTAVRFNHSCTPNVAQTWTNDNKSIIMHALTFIKAGTELCDSYCELLAPRSERQEELRAYGFECSCVACDFRNITFPYIENRRKELQRLTRDLTFWKISREVGLFGPLSASISRKDGVRKTTETVIQLLQKENLQGHDLKNW